ncbi:ABC transporter permease [Elstera litoralis]|uniref:ABC transporter permease n=2 Tax=Elstera litoralis TaxID=552518 RepID=A0A0F3IX08_9PROT|nr:ABC transporter permease [Elstera litoralis]
MIAPALLVVLGLFLVPLGLSIQQAFLDPEGGVSLANFAKAFSLYGRDVLFTVVIVTVATALTGVVSIAVGGYLVLATSPRTASVLRWLFRLPLFVPFVVVAQMMRTFLAKFGLLNSLLMSLGFLTPETAQGMLDWRGIIFAFVWKQSAFATLVIGGAMASLDRSTVEAARDLGASRLRILLEIILPQVAPTVAVTLVLSFVMMLSVLSVPIMLGTESPTMITVDMAWRVNSYRDYGVANALGVVSLLMASSVAWIYLRHAAKEKGKTYG